MERELLHHDYTATVQLDHKKPESLPQLWYSPVPLSHPSLCDRKLTHTKGEEWHRIKTASTGKGIHVG